MDYAKEYPVAMKVIAEWIEKGLLKRKFHIVNGLDAAPSALPLLYSGGNTGKLCLMFFFPATVPFSYFASPGSSRFLNTKSYPNFELCDPSLTVTPPRVCAVLPWSSPGSIHSRLTRAPSSWGRSAHVLNVPPRLAVLPCSELQYINFSICLHHRTLISPTCLVDVPKVHIEAPRTKTLQDPFNYTPVCRLHRSILSSSSQAVTTPCASTLSPRSLRHIRPSYDTRVIHRGERELCQDPPIADRPHLLHSP